MKITSFLLMLLWIVTPQLSFAQLDAYDLSTYKVPDTRLHSLIFNAGINQRNQLTGFDNNGGAGNDFSNHAGQLTFRYDGFNISRTWQNNFQLSSQSSVSYNDFNANNQSSSFLSWQTSMQLHISNRKYKNDSDFKEWGNDIQLSYRGTRGKTNGSPVDKQKAHFIQAFFPLKIGKGRIENVSFAQQAIFVLKKLRERDRLTSDLSTDDIQDFAGVIAQIRSRRVFDFRLRRIFELEKLDSFLLDRQWIDNPDIRYFTTLNDQWVYSGSIQRYSGYRFSFAVHPGIFSENLPVNFNFFPGSGANLFNLLIGMELVAEKPVNQYWQRFFSSYAYAGFTKGQLDQFNINTKSEFSEPKASFGFDAGTGYYPDTRTQFNLTLGGSIDWSLSPTNGVETKVIGLDGDLLIGFLRLDFTYFLLPRFRLTINNQLQYVNLINSPPSPFELFSPNTTRFLYYPSCQNTNCNGVFSVDRNFFHSFNISLNYELF